MGLPFPLAVVAALVTAPILLLLIYLGGCLLSDASRASSTPSDTRSPQGAKRILAPTPPCVLRRVEKGLRWCEASWGAGPLRA